MPQASCCFLLFLYFRKALKEIFSEWAENPGRSVFTRNEDQHRRSALGPPGGARHGPTLGRAWGPLVAPDTSSHRLFAYKMPSTLISSGTELFSMRGSVTSKVQSRASAFPFRHMPEGEIVTGGLFIVMIASKMMRE